MPRPGPARHLARVVACCGVLLLACAGSAMVVPARAQQAPLPMPQDTRLVVFRYDPNDTYLLLTRPGAVTHLALEPGESVVALALGDTVQWIVQDKGPNVFVKPVRPDLYTSGTLVTNRRTYQLGLRSSPEGGAWYQRVSWMHPDMIALSNDAGTDEGTAPAAQATGRTRQPDTGRVAIDGVQIDRLNFDYRLHGNAAFRPSQVFDDGRFTYVQLPASLQEMPALFVAGEPGGWGASAEGQLVNYTLRGRFMVVQRLADRFLLRLGSATVQVERVQPLDGPARTRVMATEGMHGDAQ